MARAAKKRTGSHTHLVWCATDSLTNDGLAGKLEPEYVAARRRQVDGGARSRAAMVGNRKQFDAILTASTIIGAELDRFRTPLAGK